MYNDNKRNICPILGATKHDDIDIERERKLAITFFRYALRFLWGFLLLLLVLAGALVLGSQFFSFGGNLLLRGANFFGASRNLIFQSQEVRGNPLKGYAFENLLLTWQDRPLFRAENLEITFSFQNLLRGEIPLENLEIREWFADLDAASAMPSSETTFSLGYLPRNILLEKGSLLLTSRDYELLRLEGELSGSTQILLRELSAELGSPDALPLFFRGTLRLEEENLSLLRGELFLKTTPREGDPHLLLSGDILPRQNLEFLFSEFPLEQLGKASLLQEISQVLETLRGSLSGPARIEGSLPESWNAETDLHITRGSLGGIYLSTLDLQGFGAAQGPLELLFEGHALSGGSLKGSLLSPGSLEESLSVHFSGTSLDLSLGEAVHSELATLSGVLPSLQGSYVRQGKEASGSVSFSDVRGVYKDFSFENFRGEVLLSSDKIEASLEGLLEHLPVTGEGTVLLGEASPPKLDMVFHSPGMPLHRLKGILPDLEPLRLEGNLAWEVALQGSPKNPTASAKLYSQRIRIRGELLEAPEATLLYENETLFLEKARISWKDVLFEGQGEIRNLLGTRNMKIQASALPQGNRWAREALSPEIRKFFAPQEGGKLSLLLEGTPENLKGSLSGILPQIETPLGTTGRGSLEAAITSRGVQISSLSIPLRQGEFKFGGSLERTPSGGLQSSLDGHIRNISLDPLEASGMPLKGTLEGQFRLRGSEKNPVLSFSLTSPELAFQEYRGNRISCQGSLSTEALELEELSLAFWDGRARLRGTLGPLDRDPRWNLNGEFHEIDLMNTQDLLDVAQVYLKGTGNGTLSLEGPLASPEILVNLSSPRLLLNSLAFEDVSGTLQISPEEIRLDPLVVHAGGSPLEVSVVVLPEKSWDTSFSARGEALDLGSLLTSWELFPEDHPFFPRGILKLRLQGDVRKGELRGKGHLSSPEIFGGDLRGTNLDLPFVFDNRAFTLEKGSLALYNGILHGEGALDYSQKPALWRAHLWGEEIQVAPLLRDLYPMSGDISGTGTFDLTLKGPANYIFMTTGEGNLNIREGAFSGFPQLAPLLAKSQRPGLDFASLQVYFSVDGRTLYFVPGSRLTAPPGNPIYRYFSADGFLPFTGRSMNINCLTEVNAPAINAFLGAFAGFLETVFLAEDITQLGNITQAVEDALLGGIFGGLSKSDFREISFSLKGTMEEPELANLSIATKQKAFLLNPQDREKGDRGPDFKFTFSFPTGEGKKTSDDISGQLTDQIFEQAIKQILP